ncbi:MAG: hypothetical protein AAGN82_28225 [Myxococcota bacterium]
MKRWWCRLGVVAAAIGVLVVGANPARARTPPGPPPPPPTGSPGDLEAASDGDDAFGAGVPTGAYVTLFAGALTSAVGGIVLATAITGPLADRAELARFGGCAPPVAADQVPRCEEIADLRVDYNTRMAAGWTVVGVGGAALATGILWAIIASGGDGEATRAARPRWTAVPWIPNGRRGGGISLGGHF